MLKPKTTSIVPNHFPKIKPAKRAIGEPKPKRGNTHKTVNNRKKSDNKKILVFFTVLK